jgi:hypothetical protein
MPAMTAYRDPVEAPLRKLSVDLIKTYKHINEVKSPFFLLLFNRTYINYMLYKYHSISYVFIYGHILFFFFVLHDDDDDV